MAVAITLLGPPRVERDGAQVSFDTRKALALLADLAVAERPRSREMLCELLWPEHDPDRARGALRRTLSTLRGGIGKEWLETAGDTVALLPGPGLDLDLTRFRELSAPDASAESLRAAADLFGGEFLEGFSIRGSAAFEHWHRSEAESLRRELGSVLRRLVEALVASGEIESAIPHAERWLALDPVHEPAHRELIRLYGWTGERARAMEQYRRCVRVLSQELGVGPVEETAALLEAVDQGNLAPPTAPRPAAPAAPRRPGTPDELPLVGREAELTALVEAHAGAAPDGRLAVIEGEPGIGKTRLAEELVRRAAEQGAPVLSARAHDDEASLAFGPVVELLREAVALAGDADGAWPDRVLPQRLADASLLLPELASIREDVPPARPLEGPGALTRLLEAVTSVVAEAASAEVPGVILVDDAHAADEASLDAITFLGRRLRGRGLLMVLTWRSEEVPPGHRLRRLVVELSRTGSAGVVTPGRLSEDDVEGLAEVAGLEEDTDGAGKRVFMESEGLPLFVAEYLAALRAGADPAQAAMPGEVRGLLGARLEPLGELPRQVLGAAATIGRTFDFDTVRDASGRSDDETVGALEELVAHGLVLEAGDEPDYDFSHEKLRALVYEETSPARRRLLHGRTAAAIARNRPGREGAALVAGHLQAAGDDAGAAAQHLAAAEHAASLHANADALEHLDAALALGSPDRARVHERIGDLSTLTADYSRALASYESAAAEAPPADRAAIEHKVGGVHQRRGEWERAERRLRAALEVAPSDVPGLRSRIQADLALTLNQSGRSDEATAAATEALKLAEAAADRRAEAQVHNMLGVLAHRRGAAAEAAAELDRSLVIAVELRDDSAQTAALNNLALVKRDANELDEALELTERALALCATHGDRHREAALENNLADLHNAAGREDEAMEHLKRAVAIFSEVGADEATRLPEIWKLVSW